jgi:hypothetical protein
MKELKPTLMFVGGTMFGLVLALCLGAVPKAKTAPAPAPAPAAAPVPKKDWSQLKFIGYPNGGTGIFDPATGTFYLYDSDLNSCYLIREINTLGGRMFIQR